MNAGPLKYHASIQNPASTPDGTTYTEVRKQWVNIVPIGVSKLVFLSAQGSKVSHLITAREKPEIVVGQAVEYLGQSYKVTSVQKFFGDRQEIQAELIQ